MKIGIIYCAYNTEEYLDQSLKPWLKIKELGLNGHSFILSAISVPFEKFNEPRLDNTGSILNGYLKNGKIDHLVINETPVKEVEARTCSLDYLVNNGADLVWQVDSDEFYTEQEIEKIIKFVESRPFSCSFYGSLKNYVFDKKTYLTEPFNPMRIHRVNFWKYQTFSFWDDNNILYANKESNHTIKDIFLTPPTTIPKAVQFTRHLTWLSDPRGKKKAEYQAARGWKCSFVWNETKNCLEWNPIAFSNDGKQIPETATDDVIFVD